MDIQDGSAVAQAPQVNIDTDALANALVGAIQKSNGTTNKPPTQDELIDVVQQLRASNVDETEIAKLVTGLIGVEKKAQRQTDEKINETLGRVLTQQRISEVHQFINRTIRGLCKDDDLLKAVQTTIRETALTQYANSKEVEITNTRNKHMSGQPLDEDVLEAICERAVEGIQKKRSPGESGKKAASTPAISGSTVTNRPGDGTETVPGRDELSPIQEYVYDAVFSLQRNKVGKSKEDAHKLAMTAAQRIKK